MMRCVRVAFPMLLFCLGVVLAASSPLWAQTPSAYEKAVLAKNPVAYWRLGEAKGPVVKDKTKNGENYGRSRKRRLKKA